MYIANELMFVHDSSSTRTLYIYSQRNSYNENIAEKVTRYIASYSYIYCIWLLAMCLHVVIKLSLDTSAGYM